MDHYKNLNLEDITYFCQVDNIEKVEEWKYIPGYENLYMVSNLGRVKSFKQLNVKIKKQHISKKYCVVGLYKNNVEKKYKVHALSGLTFFGHEVGNRKMVIDHKDNVQHNNILTNIQIISHRENTSKDKKGVSKFTGVSKHANGKHWQVHITINGKGKYLGIHKSEKKASEIYQNELKKYTENESFS